MIFALSLDPINLLIIRTTHFWLGLLRTGRVKGRSDSPELLSNLLWQIYLPFISSDLGHACPAQAIISFPRVLLRFCDTSIPASKSILAANHLFRSAPTARGDRSHLWRPLPTGNPNTIWSSFYISGSIFGPFFISGVTNPSSRYSRAKRVG